MKEFSKTGIPDNRIEIVVGIPSFNEEKNISFVTQKIDEGLCTYFPDKKAIIVNVDGGSSDTTRDVFLGTKTKTRKKLLYTKGITGKGNVLKELFTFIDKNNVKVCTIFDADLKSITPEWVKRMIIPIMEGYDYCTPYYARHKYDGTITNQIVYPLTYGLYGINIRQPIGGDFSFSGNLVGYLLRQEWYESTGHFGIDIFMTLSAVTGGFNVIQVGLGVKVHKPSLPNLGNMFIEVVHTLFKNILKSKKFFSYVSSVKYISITEEEWKKPAPVDVDVCEIRRKAKEGMKKFEGLYKKILDNKHLYLIKDTINAESWLIILARFLSYYRVHSDKEVIEGFSHIYFMRVYSFIKETAQMSECEAENIVRQQADIFFQNRDTLINSL